MSFRKTNITFCLILLMTMTGFGVAHAADADGDGIDDTLDNCTSVANAGQEDTDYDGHGNICDGDFDQTCMTNFSDLSLMKAGFFSADSNLDLDGSGSVNFNDLALIKPMFFSPPGPSAPGSLCNPDTDNDGVADVDDLCPGTPPGSTVDATGCVIPPQLLTATASASSSQNSEGAGPASSAVDGNMATRWGSLFNNAEWITLDLGAGYALTEVIIHWEAANAASYEIQGSADNSNWTTLSSESGGTFVRVQLTTATGQPSPANPVARLVPVPIMSPWQALIAMCACKASPAPACTAIPSGKWKCTACRWQIQTVMA